MDGPLSAGLWAALGLLVLGVALYTVYNLAAGSGVRGKGRRGSRVPDEPAAPPPAARTIKISHSLPEMRSTVVRGKVERQSTEPTRHSDPTKRSNFGRIRPELYGQLDERRDTKGRSGCGKLRFTLRYDREVEGLVVKIIQATDLAPRDHGGSSWDPYVKVHLLPDRDKKFQTKVHRRSRSPAFNETFAFGVPYKELSSRALHFSLYDLDPFSRHDLVGQVTVKGLLDACDLSHEVEYIVDIKREARDRAVCAFGELMVSLCYLPTAGRLTVTVVKARDLKCSDGRRQSDPYVKVWTVCRGQRLKKKKTTVKKATNDPVYNEALVFDVPRDTVTDVQLVVKVIDRDRTGGREPLGCCVVGSGAADVGQRHWLQMLEGPRKPVSQWYPLSDADPFSTSGHAPVGCLNAR